MARDARFTCRFPAHALGISERLADAARKRGLITWTTQRGPEYEIQFEGPSEPLIQFAHEIGFRSPEIVFEEPRKSF